MTASRPAGDIASVRARLDSAIQVDVVQDVLVHQFCVDPAGIDVSVHDGVVTLTGQVEHAELARLIGEAVGEVPGVVAVANHLTWLEPTRPRFSLSAFPFRSPTPERTRHEGRRRHRIRPAVGDPRRPNS